MKCRCHMQVVLELGSGTGPVVWSAVLKDPGRLYTCAAAQLIASHKLLHCFAYFDLQVAHSSTTTCSAWWLAFSWGVPAQHGGHLSHGEMFCMQPLEMHSEGFCTSGLKSTHIRVFLLLRTVQRTICLEI